MTAITTWWGPRATEALAIRPGLPRRGSFGGQCFHPTCRQAGADWYNTIDHRYYCDLHARAMNEASEGEDLPSVCVLHL